MADNNYPIVVHDILAPEEGEALWRDGGITTLALAIIASIREDALRFQPDGDIIEVEEKANAPGLSAAKR